MREIDQAEDIYHLCIQQHPTGPSSPPFSGGGAEVDENVHYLCLLATKGINALGIHSSIGYMIPFLLMLISPHAQSFSSLEFLGVVSWVSGP